MVRRGVLALAGAALAVVTWTTRPGTVYTVYAVPEVMAGLARHPSAWVGRTILVRGRVLGRRCGSRRASGPRRHRANGQPSCPM